MRCEYCHYKEVLRNGDDYDYTEEGYYCSKRYGDPNTDTGCKHVFLFQIKRLILAPYYWWWEKRFFKRMSKELSK